jgi:hypothetical protein
MRKPNEGSVRSSTPGSNDLLWKEHAESPEAKSVGPDTKSAIMTGPGHGDTTIDEATGPAACHQDRGPRSHAMGLR